MARPRKVITVGPLLDFERARGEAGELLGELRSAGFRRGERGFSPRADVYYTDSPPRAVVKLDLAGVRLEDVSLEVTGRELVVSGARPVQEAEGRVYQRLEIDTGRFRRRIELGADVVSDEARATYEDGILHVELPLRVASQSRQVPIERTD